MLQASDWSRFIDKKVMSRNSLQSALEMCLNSTKEEWAERQGESAEWESQTEGIYQKPNEECDSGQTEVTNDH